MRNVHEHDCSSALRNKNKNKSIGEKTYGAHVVLIFAFHWSNKPEKNTGQSFQITNSLELPFDQVKISRQKEQHIGRFSFNEKRSQQEKAFKPIYYFTHDSHLRNVSFNDLKITINQQI